MAVARPALDLFESCHHLPVLPSVIEREIETGYALSTDTLFFSHNRTDMIVLSCAIDPI